MQKVAKFLMSVLLVCVAIFTGCSNVGNAQSVAIWETTSTGSTDSTFFVNFMEEKDYKNLGVDIWIKSKTDNATFQIKKELDSFVTISLPQKNMYYSLGKLMASAKNKNFEYTIYKDAVSKAYIINSEQEYNLTIKTVVGEISTYKTILLSTLNVSKEFNIIVKAKECK